ncbi:hypothetical protein [Streptomyces sp. NPDC056190]|uniref:hypothetical protein n=1 Tax=unclassified Streptomyces TaxID=2593676 RepID=UPI0035DBA0B9
MWTERLLTASGLANRDVRMDWGEAETALNVHLPADYKELCRAFGIGEFSRYLGILSPRDMLATVKSCTAEDAEPGGLLHPYRIHADEPGGLIPWGWSHTDTLFFWHAEPPEPGAWPVLVRNEADEEWHRYDMIVSEFITRTLTDPDFTPGFEGVSVARSAPVPTFEPA